ncbi:hypothetical protein M0813_21370 [Anaeramoeba flamelloides]|uniref:Uncharacterized protein n=1 Tax=Anaeramoeba flamelloides TaxID=1746091 RepID=A0ABQ8YHP5_9EUKA|nr:hypothetical protein M0813_21370 [Anaeramoeba flamelloides]
MNRESKNKVLDPNNQQNNNAKSRKKTKNHTRLEELINLNDGSISGITIEQLSQPNCPKRVQIHKSLLSDPFFPITKSEIDCYFLTKFNLCPHVQQNYTQSDWVLYSIEPQNFANTNLLDLCNKPEIKNRIDSISNYLIQKLTSSKELIQGLDTNTIENISEPPKKIIILKSSIDKMGIKYKGSPRMIERGLIFFFNVRFNLFNQTGFNRLKMCFTPKIDSQVPPTQTRKNPIKKKKKIIFPRLDNYLVSKTKTVSTFPSFHNKTFRKRKHPSNFANSLICFKKDCNFQFNIPNHLKNPQTDTNLMEIYQTKLKKSQNIVFQNSRKSLKELQQELVFTLIHLKKKFNSEIKI